MGLIIAKFRKEKSSYEILEKLEFDIKAIEDYGQSTEKQRRTIIANIIISSVGIYVAGAALTYQYFLPQSWSERLLYVITPLLVFPFMIILFKKLVAWYFDRKISRNASKLLALREKKRKILDEVMEKKTYKEAQKILERFDERPTLKKLTPSSPILPRSPIVTAKILSVPNVASLMPRDPAIRPTNTSMSVISNTLNSSALPISPSHNKTLPRPILSLNRSFLDKMVDYIIGVGPTGRFALICTVCHNHNGMALEEEFEYLAFRCAFCATFNPARKGRPIAPALESDESKDSKSDDSEEDNDENVGDDKVNKETTDEGSHEETEDHEERDA